MDFYRSLSQSSESFLNLLFICSIRNHDNHGNQKPKKAVIETNLHGPWNCMQEAFDQYMKDNGGYIVNIVTTNRTGMAGMSHSGAARAGTKERVQYFVDLPEFSQNVNLFCRLKSPLQGA